MSATKRSRPRIVRLGTGRGVTLVLEDSGPCDGDPVLLLHGGAQTRRAWTTVANRLSSKGWHTVAPDLRGHGESSWSPIGDYSVGALRGDATKLINYAGAPLHLVGASLGGLISLLIASRRPDLVTSLTLVDVVANNNTMGENRIRAFLAAHPEGFDNFDQVADAVAAYQSHRTRPSDTSGLRNYVRRGSDGALRWHWDPQFLLKHGHPWTRHRQHTLAQAAQRLQIPTLLLLGELSDIVDQPSLQRFQAQVPHAEVRLVPEAHHMIAGDQNDAFGTEVIHFLEKHQTQC